MNNQQHGVEGDAAAGAQKGFSFVPRRLVDRPAAFGKVSKPLRPAPGVSEQDPRFRSALLQHRLADQVRQYLSLERRSIAWFAAPQGGFPGISADRMRRMLRGETMMQVTDIMLICGRIPPAATVTAGAVGYDVERVRKLAGDVQRYSDVVKLCTCNAKAKYRDSVRLFGSDR